jgi:hypothetical protein
VSRVVDLVDLVDQNADGKNGPGFGLAAGATPLSISPGRAVQDLLRSL